MKTTLPLSRTVSRPVRSLYLACSLFACALIAFAAAPQWWTDQAVLNTETPNDFGAVNVGQLKHMASKAREEMIAKGYDVSSLDADLLIPYLPLIEQPSDHYPVKLGQLKFVSSHFYDLLGMAYPWDTDPAGPAADDALANIGQVKFIFSFEIPERIPPDTEAPSVPSNFQAVLYTHELARFEWDASTDNVAVSGYQLYRNGSLLASDIQGTYYTDTSVSQDTNYTYEVTAVDAAGNTSARSSPVALTTDSFFDSDDDGMDDVWEEQIVAADSNDEIQSINDVALDDDYDGDGITNIVEFENKLNPLVADGLVSYTPRIDGIQTLGEGRVLLYTELNALNAGTLNLERTIDGSTSSISTHGPNTDPLLDVALPTTGNHSVTYRIQAELAGQTGAWSSSFTFYLQDGGLYFTDPANSGGSGSGNGSDNNPQPEPASIPTPSYAAIKMLDSSGVTTQGITNDGSILFSQGNAWQLKKLSGETIAITTENIPATNDNGAALEANFSVNAISGDGHIVGSGSYYNTSQTDTGSSIESDNFGILWGPNNYSQPSVFKDDPHHNIEDNYDGVITRSEVSSIYFSHVANGGLLGGMRSEKVLSSSRDFYSGGEIEGLPTFSTSSENVVSKTFYNKNTFDNDESEVSNLYKAYHEIFRESPDTITETRGNFAKEDYSLIDMNGEDTLVLKKTGSREYVAGEFNTGLYTTRIERSYFYNATELDYQPLKLNNPVTIPDSAWSNVTWIVGRKDSQLVASIDFGEETLSQINIDDYTATPYISDADENGLVTIAAGSYLYKQEYLIDPETEALIPLLAFNRFHIAQDILNSSQAMTVKGISDNGMLLLDVDSATGNSDPEFPNTLDEGYYSLLNMDMAVDKDRSGTENDPGIQFGGPDRTAEDDPYVFWVNNDSDIVPSDSVDEGDDADPGATIDDYIDGQISNKRDLEDFSRLWLNVSGILTQLRDGSMRLGLDWQNISDGNPAIRLYKAVESDGGMKYLFDENIAGNQISPTGGGSSMIGMLTSTSSVNGVIDGKRFFPQTFWDDVGEDGIAHLLFEAQSPGKGQLVFALQTGGAGSGQDILISSSGVWFDLRDVKKMYQHFTVGDSIDVDPSSAASLLPESATKADLDNMDLEDDYILFVHGWRMKPYERRAFAETSFKRLYWQGYRGRFGLFSWPTEWADRIWWLFDLPDPTDPLNYQKSERKARISGDGLKGQLIELANQYSSSNLHVFAHSMGNVVVSEALRERFSDVPGGSSLIQTYIACQSASVAHSYDSVNPEVILDSLDVTTPEVYGNYPISGRPYFDDIDSVANNIVNFHNREDSALSGWEYGQDLLKPNYGWGYDPLLARYFRGIISLPTNTILTFPTDRYEILAHISNARSKALGAAEYGSFSVRGSINDSFNLNSGFSTSQNYTDTSEDHSAQFRSINMRRAEFFRELLDYMGL